MSQGDLDIITKERDRYKAILDYLLPDKEALAAAIKERDQYKDVLEKIALEAGPPGTPRKCASYYCDDCIAEYARAEMEKICASANRTS